MQSIDERAADAFREAGGRHAHCLGVCGVGMAGVACLLKERGWRVSGCDAAPNARSRWLAGRGIAVCGGHDPAHVAAGVDVVVRSAAVGDTLPEVRAAAERRIPVFARGRVLAALLEGRTSVAVGGTHGKTTTTAFLTHILRVAGLDPGWCIGGETPGLDGVAGTGGGVVFCVEADESDGTLVHYRPDIAVLTNIELDHVEHFRDPAELKECFRIFARQARRTVIYGADDPRAFAAVRGLPDTVGCGMGDGAAVRAARIREDSDRIAFDAIIQGETAGRVRIPVPGRHNVSNALTALAAAVRLGVAPAAACAALESAALPLRRFERVVFRDGLHVISDYAHHPTEIAALVRTACRVACRRRVAVFQPHRYTRTLALAETFPPAFRGLDELILVPVYAASERPLAGGSVWDLYDRFRRSAAGASAPVVRVAGSLQAAWQALRVNIRPGDLLLIVGAGDVVDLASLARDEWGGAEPRAVVADGCPPPDLYCAASRMSAGVSLAGRTTLGVGGAADCWADVGSPEDLARMLNWAGRARVPFRILGAGSNVLVGDLGLRGITARLTGSSFAKICCGPDGVRAGAAVPLAVLLDHVGAAGLSGLEFLEGVPGTVGGALAMNAGAWDDAIGAHTAWIRCLNADGTECTVPQSELGWGYRVCGALRNRVAVEAGFALVRDDPRSISRRRETHRARRAWMRGLRSAGSVFRNPAVAPAGRLLEEAGWKGRGVGGAAFCEAHANVIVTGPEACASDVRALIELARRDIETRRGVRLETEIRIWE